MWHIARSRLYGAIERPEWRKIDWDRWKSTYRDAGRVSDEGEFANWADNVAGFEFLMLNVCRDKQKLGALQQQSAKISAPARVMVCGFLTRWRRRSLILRWRGRMSGLTAGRIRGFGMRMIGSCSCATVLRFNPWFDNQILHPRGDTLAESGETRVTDTLNQAALALDAMTAAAEAFLARGAGMEDGQ